jgi:P27 family predicted phage terminase small subunit
MTKLPAAPAHLRLETRRWWRQIVADYELESHHLRLFQAVCESWDEYRSATEVVRRDGQTVVDRFGQLKPHPLIAVARDARIAFYRGLRELALDVSAPAESRPPGIRGIHAA